MAVGGSQAVGDGSLATVLESLHTSAEGLSSQEAAVRLVTYGPNAVRSHHPVALRLLVRQLRSPVLLLLAATAVLSAFLGNGTESVIIGLILGASVGLGFTNEYRAERAAAGLHDLLRHTALVRRDGDLARVDVTEVVPGDVVQLSAGVLVPADLRLLSAEGLECNEAVLTGESESAEKAVRTGPLLPTGTPPAPGAAGADAAGGAGATASMGTIVRAGLGTGVVVATGASTQFGRIAVGLGEREPETEFQRGLRSFSVLLLQVAVTLTALIFVTNLVLHRPIVESLLFSLAIAVGITPQLLPAVVSMSLAVGSRQLAQRKVLVKRLVCIEDLGDMDILVTDKTGTLTDGSLTLTASLDAGGGDTPRVARLALLACDVPPPSGDRAPAGPDGAGVAAPAGAAGTLDAALVRYTTARQQAAGGGLTVGPGGGGAAYERLALLPFDHQRRMTTVLVRAPDGDLVVVTKGAPESVLSRCVGVPEQARATVEGLFGQGSRVVAVASRPAEEGSTLDAAAECDLQLAGFLVFLDAPKIDAHEALSRLAGLGISVKVATGDNALVAAKVCADVGLATTGSLTGDEIERLDDAALGRAAAAATVFARVSPEQKSRIVRVLRGHGRAVGFLGDGVNDALALHAADVGLSVDTATDVAKDAADVILLEKDLGVVADGVVEGRRIFANTIKYVLMGTSSNFGNMFSAAAASSFLAFLPMLPSQILLNNLLYDTGQLAIPTDRVDEEQLRAPSHWDMGAIRRFMMFFGPLSSVFDFLTFAVLLGGFHAGPDLFRTGWFIESLATQTLVIFVFRTRRRSWRSRPSRPLVATSAATVVVGLGLTFSPLAGLLGFVTPPLGFLLTVALMAAAYLVLIEGAKRVFFAEVVGPRVRRRWRGRPHRVERRAAAFSRRAG
ncbi:MAG: HAD-IC family P-type ATPase [Actinomycetota bacterium]|nr:HAD-IC family P-type ATPase [Actinomycetota bacterium]